MLPYPGSSAIDLASFHHVPTSMQSMGTLGMNPSSFTHSWLVPTQDLCAVPYKQLPNQQQNHQLVEIGHTIYCALKFTKICVGTGKLFGNLCEGF